MKNPFKKKVEEEHVTPPTSLYLILPEGTHKPEHLADVIERAHQGACREGLGLGWGLSNANSYTTPHPQIIYRLIPVARVEKGQPLITPLDDE